MPRRRRGHRIAARSVLDSPEHGASLVAGRAGSLSFVALCTRFVDWNAFAVTASDATADIEDRQSAVGILMHFHRRPDEVRTQRALRYLYLAIKEAYAVVIANDAFFLNA
jgi:hypothetical protein